MSKKLKLTTCNRAKRTPELVCLLPAGYFPLSFRGPIKSSFSTPFLCWFESLTIYFYSAVGYIFIF